MFGLTTMLLWMLFVNGFGRVQCAGPDYDAKITNYLNELKEDGSFRYNFDASNGISQEESGVGSQFAKGSSKYYTPEGQLIQLTYTADGNNGFQAQGAHLPTPPPIPEAILKSLEYIRLHPYNEQISGYYSPPTATQQLRTTVQHRQSSDSSSSSNSQYYQQHQQQKFFYRKF